MKQFDLHDSILGKQAATPEKYDASLLFRIPRAENRVHYGIEASNLPFIGFDVWNCYEVSFLTDNGFPVSRVLKLVYSSESQYLVESKSLKLYLNSFNMDRFGKTVLEAEKTVGDIILRDLRLLLESEVFVSLFDSTVEVRKPFPSVSKVNLSSLVPNEVHESIDFSRFKESPELLRSQLTDSNHKYGFHSDLLRSNCRVTNQPDWGDLYVRIVTKHEIDLSSIIEYLVSFRKENHFHEEVVEMIYKRFYDIFEPEKLMVAALYTRRGGIDINPIRASHSEFIDETLISSEFRVEKTLRQ
ncbi:MAG: NADPH-dependent 7-cyano-7-deazaguanine reductase QueF [Paludibacter sp.]|nr:NADPH-dependent 7-cyano-7-deazaguanine reductase QueF [Paludibacter sp.]